MKNHFKKSQNNIFPFVVFIFLHCVYWKHNKIRDYSEHSLYKLVSICADFHCICALVSNSWLLCHPFAVLFNIFQFKINSTLLVPIPVYNSDVFVYFLPVSSSEAERERGRDTEMFSPCNNKKTNVQHCFCLRRIMQTEIVRVAVATVP